MNAAWKRSFSFKHDASKSHEKPAAKPAKSDAPGATSYDRIKDLPASELFQIVTEYINQNYDSVSKLANNADHAHQQGVEIQDKSMELLHSLRSAESAIEKVKQAKSAKKSSEVVDESVDAVDESVDAVNEPADVVNEPVDVVNEPADVVNEPADVVNEPVEQSVNEPIRAPASEPVNSAASEAAPTPITTPVTTPVNEPTKAPITLPAQPTYHVTANLDPSTLLQHAADQAQLPLSSEDADRLVEAMAPASEETEELVWRFIDAQGFERGPFAASTMRAWWDNGYLTPSVAVKYRNEAWRPVQACFSSLANAFLEPPVEGSRAAERRSATERHSATERRVGLRRVGEKQLPKTLASVIRKREEAHSLPAPVTLVIPKQEETKPETPAVLPVKNAMDLSAALSLQQEIERQAEQQETVPEPVSRSRQPTVIPSLKLARDARRSQQPVAPTPSMAPATEAPVAQSKPLVSPWTRQPLDSPGPAPSSLDYASKIGRGMKPETPSAPIPVPTSYEYSNRVGISLVPEPAQPKKSVWGATAVADAVPLNQILREQREASGVKAPASVVAPSGAAKEKAATAEKEKTTPEKLSGKKGKSQWTRVDLRSPALHMRPTAATAPKGKSFQAIMEEQKLEQDRKKEQKPKASSGAWSTLFSSSSLPVLGMKHEKPAPKPVESEPASMLFWEVPETSRKTKKESAKPVILDRERGRAG